MKKPSFVIYASGYVACMLGCCFGISAGIRYDLPVLLVLAGEAAVWSSMIFDRYYKRLHDYLSFRYDHFAQFAGLVRVRYPAVYRDVSTLLYEGVSPDQEVAHDA